MTPDNAAALNAALELATQAKACFPLGRDKCPAIPKTEGGKGFKDATTDQHSLRAMWAHHPGPLVGITTGTISGIDVLDIDQKPEGRAWWTENRHRIPPTRAHRTRSRGLRRGARDHRFCLSPLGARRLDHVAPGETQLEACPFR